ncbi:MAG: PQQ-dependent sugar dehydrogenase [Actinomycetota bacterium]|nr:PQQ-dependent sugar dehydrogenase [Actinomycetota bacterium]
MRAGIRVFGDVRLRWALIAALLVAPLGIIRAAPAQGAATLPSGFVDVLVAQVDQPTGLTFTPDGRMIVIGKRGKVLVYKNDVFLKEAIDLSPQVCSEWERGLVGVALDPDFGKNANRAIYFFYTHNRKGVSTCPIVTDVNRPPVSEFPSNRVSKFTLNDDNTINLSSEVVILDHIPSTGLHGSGHLAFGPLDKLLYVSVGDGGCTYPDMANCQSGNTNARRNDLLFGKILRLNKDGTFPASNPYAGDADVRRCGNPAGVPSGTGRCGEIFATGLRNPFRFAFQPGTQNFYINDVGTGIWEEIDKGAKGADYGFNVREGHCKNASSTDCQVADGSVVNGLTNPIFDYHHNTGCASIVGGAWVPNGLWGAPYDGSYLFADYVCGKILRLAPKAGGGFSMVPFVEGLGSSSAVHMEFGPLGATQALYYTTFEENDGVHRISKGLASEMPPTASFTATPKSSTNAPLTVTFNGAASADPDNDDLDFHWDFKDGTGPLKTEEPTAVHTFTREGAFNVSLKVEDDARLSAPVTQLIEVGDPPTPTIVSPSTDARFKIDELVTLSGAGTDPDETLASSQFSWTVIRHHNNTHTHPFLGPITGKTLTFRYPQPEDLDAASDSRLEAFLTVTDSTGISRTVARDLIPRKVQITIQDNRSTPLRLFANDLLYNGQGTFTSWPGYRIQLHAPSPQQFPGRYYKFQSWSDGGAQTHDIITPSANATFTAKFTSVDGVAPTQPPPPPPPPPTGVMGIARTATGFGYWLTSEKGKVQAFGNATHLGDASNLSLNKPVAGITSTPSGRGYWLVATDGGVFSYGDAQFWGSTGGIALNKPVVGIASTPTGKGYWLVATDGGIFSFGDAQFWGSTGGVALNKPVVAMDSTPSGKGYWLVAADGGIFTFGDAPFKGSTGGMTLNKPIVAMERTTAADGYWLMASDGGVFAFPEAGFHGSTAAFPPASMGVGIAGTPDDKGYWLAFLDSTVAAFGNAPDF